MRELGALVGSGPLIAVGSDVVVRRKEENGAEEVRLQLSSDYGLWGMPGGSLEPGESLEDAARRELHEEAGLLARELRLLCVCSGPGFDHTYPNGDRIHNVVADYLALGTTGTPRPDPEEGLEANRAGMSGTYGGAWAGREHRVVASSSTSGGEWGFSATPLADAW